MIFTVFSDNILIEDLLKDVLNLKERYTKHWLNRIFEMISLEAIMKQFLIELSLDHFLEFLRLEEIYQLIQQYIPFEYYVASPFKAYSLRKRIILCHHELTNILRTLLGKREIKSVKEALDETKRAGLINEDEYKILREFNELRNKIHHLGSLTYHDKRLTYEIENAEKAVKNIISRIKSEQLRYLVECLQEIHIIF